MAISKRLLEKKYSRFIPALRIELKKRGIPTKRFKNYGYVLDVSEDTIEVGLSAADPKHNIEFKVEG